MDSSLLAVQSIIQKHTIQWIILHYRQFDQELAVFLFSELSSEEKMLTKIEI